jgi:oligopeptide transport system substrate-binding protein
MDNVRRLHRRELVRSAVAVTAAYGLIRAGPARAGDEVLEQWNPADGVRLAGPVSGLSSLDPALVRETGAMFLLQQLYRGLVSLDAALDPVPELAARVDRAADGLDYDIALHPGAAFHDGRAVTPEDVLGSFTRALDPGTAGGDASALAAVTFLRDIAGADDVLAGTAGTLTGVEVTGDRTLTIRLARSSPAFLTKLASVTASIVDVTQVAGDPGWADAPNGSGPFRLRSWTPESLLELEAADTWWAGRPEVAAIEARLGTSATLPLNLYQAGAIDMVWSVPAELVDLVQDPASGVSYGDLVRTELFATSYIAFSNAVPPFDDPHVRRALQLVFPSDAIAGAMFDGTVVPASGIVPPGMAGRDWRVDRPVPDVEAARAALARSRYGSASAVPPMQVYAADIAPVEALRDVGHHELGLRIEAIQVNWPEFIGGLVNGRFPAYAIFWSADYPDPESMIDMLFASKSADNYTGYANPALDDLIEQARREMGAARLDLFARANQLLVEDVAVLPLYHDVGFALNRPGMAGLRVTPMGLLGLESLHGQP